MFKKFYKKYIFAVIGGLIAILLAFASANYWSYNNHVTLHLDKTVVEANSAVTGKASPHSKVHFKSTNGIDNDYLYADSNGNFSENYLTESKYKVYATKNGVKSKSYRISMHISDEDNDDTDSSSSSSSSISSSSSRLTKYPNVSSIFDLNSIESQNSSSLFKTVELKGFNIVDMGADSMKQYHLLISPNGHSDTYFLAVFDHKLSGKLDTYNTVTIDGTLNGKSKLDGTQVNTGISSDYLGKKVILINVDKVSKK
ncbi:hypothetical protein [Lactiplantibacillus plantarum]|uniref:hypothetical protein n=1 Tax=Lactiplantibacillus plantarum TaxID=1590 RepID=UPI001080FE01|nr:hypothetical protein [Lactiplantibacillus plantarum]QBX93217.1 hypothetical protein DVH03_02135 [Lactiplantibacillus plantarum]